MDFHRLFFEFLELPEMQRAFWIAIIIGPIGGLLGTFVTLRRMSFFSDAISHGAMTGVTLGFALSLTRDINSPAMQIILVAFCVLMALLMAWLMERTTLHTDTIIAFSYTGSVALGVVVFTRMQSKPVLHDALFGDILASTQADVWIIAGVGALILLFLVLNLRALTLSVVQEHLAKLEGFNTRRLNYFFVVLIAIAIAVLLKLLGALLISGLIVVPAAAARIIAGNFRGMLGLSALFGLIGAVVGVYSSYHLDSPTGPTMVLADSLILLICLVISAVVGMCARRRVTAPALALKS